MKKFIIGIILSVLFLLAPIVLGYFGLVYRNQYMLTGAGAVVLLYMIIRRPLANLVADGRQSVEYDEFGRSRRKGDFKKLSRAEQDAIDLQKTADMERLLSQSVINRIIKQGSKNPEKDLADMTGLAPVKNKVSEMAARMQFEKQNNKGKSKKNRINSMSGRHMVFYGSAGTGKAQPLYSKVLTPNGFVRMGDIKVGDFVISGTNRVSKVLGVYPQGEKNIYEITFDDGSKCRCSDEHLWTVQTDSDRRSRTYRTIELKEMLDNVMIKFGNHFRRNYSVDYVEPIDFEHKDFYIHPYLLGFLIGNNSLEDTARIKLYVEQLKKNVCSFLPNEYELSLQDSGLYSLKYNGNGTDTLDYNLNLLWLKGCGLFKMFIPKEYLYSDVEQRKWLLKGLLDTIVTPCYIYNSGIECTVFSHQLKDDIIELVHSLGGYANGKDYMTYPNSYQITIQFPVEYKDCFNLERKQADYSPKRSKKAMKRYIADIKYIGKEECQCIYIDDPSHLYITDNYIITHNTTVCRIIAGFLYKYGYIKKNKVVEVDGNFLKAGAETAAKVKLITQYAYDGVLFIDEAYVLCEGAYGAEAVATLIKEMEDNRDRFICILAGYTQDMNRLLEFNTGFKSRIREYLNFPDYSIPEMQEIFCSMAHSQNFAVSGDALKKLEIRLAKEKQLHTFGNGRTVRNVLDEAVDRHSLNIVSGKLPPSERFRICGDDISTTVQRNRIT